MFFLGVIVEVTNYEDDSITEEDNIEYTDHSEETGMIIKQEQPMDMECVEAGEVTLFLYKSNWRLFYHGQLS